MTIHQRLEISVSSTPSIKVISQWFGRQIFVCESGRLCWLECKRDFVRLTLSLCLRSLSYDKFDLLEDLTKPINKWKRKVTNNENTGCTFLFHQYDIAMKAWNYYLITSRLNACNKSNTRARRLEVRSQSSVHGGLYWVNHFLSISGSQPSSVHGDFILNQSLP